MTDIEKLLVTNYMEAVGQVQRYTFLGIGASISALALALKRPTPGARDDITVPGTFVALNARAAHSLLLALCVAVGVMAYISAMAANLIASRLQSSPDLLSAVSTFPSFATSPYNVRYLIALLPFLFSLPALLFPELREKPVDWKALFAWIIMLGAPYIFLALELGGLIRAR